MTQQSVSIQRQGKDASFPFLVFLSMIGHVLIILLAISLPHLLSRNRAEPFGGPSGSDGLNVMTVDFGMKLPGQPNRKQTVEEEPAPSRYISKLNKEPDVPLESKTSLPDPDQKKKEKEPTARGTLNQKERKTEGTFGTGKNTKTEDQKTGTTGSGKFGIGTFGTGARGEGGYGTGTGIPFPFPWYIESVLTKIELNWSKPFISDPTPRNYVSVVYFVITRVGQVKQVQLEQSSGVPALDRSAESAILGAAPLPPLPNQWTEPELAFRVTFTYTK
jgi:TonB family protein